MKEKMMLTLATIFGVAIVLVIVLGSILEFKHSVPVAIGGLVVGGIFAFELWTTIRTRNFGKFDKTSKIIWGSLAAAIIIIILAGIVVLHSSSKPAPAESCSFVNGKYGSAYICK